MCLICAFSKKDCLPEAKRVYSLAGNRTQIKCLEGSCAMLTWLTNFDNLGV